MLWLPKIFGNTEKGADYVAVFAAEVLAGSINATGLGYCACASGAPWQKEPDSAVCHSQKAAEGSKTIFGGGRPGGAKGGWKGRKRCENLFKTGRKCQGDSVPFTEEDICLRLPPLCERGCGQGSSFYSSDGGHSGTSIGLPLPASLSCGNRRYGQEKRHIW